MFVKYRKQKWNNVITTVDGYKFKSKGEAKCYQEFLKPKLESGEVLFIEVHPQYRLTPEDKVEWDYTVWFASGEVWCLDFKGSILTTKFRNGKAKFDRIHPLAPLKIIQKIGNEYVIKDDLN